VVARQTHVLEVFGSNPFPASGPVRWFKKLVIWCMSTGLICLLV
jgi:hypothetical protein